jgi:signal transduction histidine kinase
MDSLVHDVRNPLNALAINVEILHEKLSRASGGQVPAAQEKNLQAMREQIVRVNTMLGDFARFLAPAPAAPTVVSLAAVVREVMGILGHAGRRARVRISADAPEGLAAVEAMDPSALGFLVLVSVLRAIERTPEEGPVTGGGRRDRGGAGPGGGGERIRRRAPRPRVAAAALFSCRRDAGLNRHHRGSERP